MPLSTLRLEPRGSTKTELMLFGADSELLQSLERLSGDLPFISYAPGSGPQVVAKFGLDALWATPMIGAELFGAGPSFPLHEARVFETPVPGLSSSGESRPLPENAEQPHAQDFQNLTRCQNGYYPCNRQLLSPDQLADVDVRDTRRNLMRCQNGFYPCNRQLLTTDQLADVDVRETKRNLMRCQNGFYPCNRQLLTTDQLADVDVRDTKRNLMRCLNGYYPCNQQLLTSDELTHVQQRASQRGR